MFGIRWSREWYLKIAQLHGKHSIDLDAKENVVGRRRHRHETMRWSSGWANWIQGKQAMSWKSTLKALVFALTVQLCVDDYWQLEEKHAGLLRNPCWLTKWRRLVTSGLSDTRGGLSKIGGVLFSRTSVTLRLMASIPSSFEEATESQFELSTWSNHSSIHQSKCFGDVFLTKDPDVLFRSMEWWILIDTFIWSKPGLLVSWKAYKTQYSSMIWHHATPARKPNHVLKKTVSVSLIGPAILRMCPRSKICGTFAKHDWERRTVHRNKRWSLPSSGYGFMMKKSHQSVKKWLIQCQIVSPHCWRPKVAT